jgi:hypothetical protein
MGLLKQLLELPCKLLGLPILVSGGSCFLVDLSIFSLVGERHHNALHEDDDHAL